MGEEALEELGNMLLISRVGCIWPVSYTHLDVYKRQVLAEDMTGKNTISLQGIAPGIYTATIDADGVRETQQLTIQ